MIQIGEGFDERWTITSIDQSILAADIRGDRPRSGRGVSVRAAAYGARYDAWLHEDYITDTMDPDGELTIKIHAYVQAQSFDLALMELRHRIRDIEEANPV